MPAKRPAIPPETRLAVYRRDGWRCAYCARSLPVSQLTMDHVIPLSRGGHPIDRRNLVAACLSCNQQKGNRTPHEAKMSMVTAYPPPGWRDGQTKHPRRIVEAVYAERPRIVPLTDPVLYLAEPCRYCGVREGHGDECVMVQMLAPRNEGLLAPSREEYRRRLRHRDRRNRSAGRSRRR